MRSSPCRPTRPPSRAPETKPGLAASACRLAAPRRYQQSAARPRRASASQRSPPAPGGSYALWPRRIAHNARERCPICLETPQRPAQREARATGLTVLFAGVRALTASWAAEFAASEGRGTRATTVVEPSLVGRTDARPSRREGRGGGLIVAAPRRVQVPGVSSPLSAEALSCSAIARASFGVIVVATS